MRVKLDSSRRASAIGSPTLVAMTTAEVFAAAPSAARGLRVTEYDVLVDAGLLMDEPVELLEGALVRMSPQQPAHAEAVRRVARALAPQLPDGWVLSVQSPFVAGDRSEPEPDIAVVPDEDYSRRHPSSAALVVEVSRSSRAIDLGVKAQLYAASGVPEYWVLDLASRSLHAHRAPSATGYADVVVREQGPVATATSSRLAVDVGDVLPLAEPSAAR